MDTAASALDSRGERLKNIGGPIRGRLGSGDGGSRTRVRNCAKSGVYECVRCSNLALGSPHRLGYLEPALLNDVPSLARTFLPG